jgi:hypothetical protein
MFSVLSRNVVIKRITWAVTVLLLFGLPQILSHLGCGTGLSPELLNEEYLNGVTTTQPVPVPTNENPHESQDDEQLAENPTDDPTYPYPSGPTPTGTPTPPPSVQKGVCGNLYDLSDLEIKNRLPDFTKISPIGKIVLDDFAIDKRNYKTGIPGVPKNFNEYFALEFKGLLRISKAGEYGFSLRTDDGARLWIDGKEIINRDGLRSMKNPTTGKITLSEGKHSFTLQYFQGPKSSVGLWWAWKVPARKWEPIPAGALEGFGYTQENCIF